MNRSLQLLKDLVAFDTTNPPRSLTAGEGIFAYLRGLLDGSWTIVEEDLGDGCVSFLAYRGAPKVLFNVHLDTVPAAKRWERDPWELAVTDDRAIGLGACDIKGAAAAILAAIEIEEPTNCAFLFTSDEEAGSSRCVKHFCGLAGHERSPQHDLPIEAVIVSEPTQCTAVVEHRGIATGKARFEGVSGHASSGRADQDSALHHAIDWTHEALEFARSHDETTYDELRGIRLNLGRVEGGVKPNMIASEAMVWWGCRPLPDQDGEALLREMCELGPHRPSFEPGFIAPSLPAATEAGSPRARARAARGVAERYELAPGTAVDFWTEAALFSAAGYDTIVFGPGDIAQAHTAGEWVRIAELEAAVEAFRRIMRG